MTSPAPASRKVFGVGLPRTGTTSLKEAMNVLGFRAHHFPDGPHLPREETVWGWARAGADPRRVPALLHRHDAFFDVPIPLAYRELAAAFPGAAFVLSTRDVEAWLDSCERLLSAEGRRKYGMDDNPRIDEMHERLYGRTTFDRETFRDRYERHAADVRAYFLRARGSFREHPFFEVDVTSGTDAERWGRLCEPLSMEIPDRPFPAANAWRSPR